MRLGEEALSDALRPHLALQVGTRWLCACGWGRGEDRTVKDWQDHRVAAALSALPPDVVLLDVATLALHWHNALWRYHEVAPQTFGAEGCECITNARLVVAAARRREPPRSDERDAASSRGGPASPPPLGRTKTGNRPACEARYILLEG